MLISDGEQRRGGYGVRRDEREACCFYSSVHVQDGGGLTLDNKLPLAEPVAVRGEAEMKQELESIRQRLGSTTDWVERIQALLRLEGLIRGGAAQRWSSFFEGLKPLRDPLVAQVPSLVTSAISSCSAYPGVQISDRRSAVSRQACHIVAMLAVCAGQKFEPFALFFIPVITKV